MKWLHAFGCGLLLLSPLPATSQAEDKLDHSRLPGHWAGDYVEPRNDVLEIKIEQDRNGPFKLHARMKAIDQTWQQVGKAAEGQPIKFSYKPRTEAELPDETPKGEKLTTEIQKEILKSKEFYWQLELRSIEDWGACNAILNGLFYPGVIELEKTDDGFKFKSARASVPGGTAYGDTPRTHHFHRLNPSVKFVSTSQMKNGICTPFTNPTPGECDGVVYRFIFPGSQYGTEAGRKLADAEIERTKDFYAKNYCIYFRVEDVPAPDEAATKKIKEYYNKWYSMALDQVGGNKEKFGTNSLGGGTPKEFVDLAGAIQQLVPGKNRNDKNQKLLIVFIDEYVASLGPSRGEAIVSGNQEHIHQIGINWVDSQSPYILAHELIHAFGKRKRAQEGDAEAGTSKGSKTWFHGACPNALSHVTRDPTTVRTPINLGGRFLDKDEYDEIAVNKAAEVLTCQSMVKHFK